MSRAFSDKKKYPNWAQPIKRDKTLPIDGTRKFYIVDKPIIDDIADSKKVSVMDVLGELSKVPQIDIINKPEIIEPAQAIEQTVQPVATPPPIPVNPIEGSGYKRKKGSGFIKYFL